ncbi:sortase [Faecalimonas sp.]
MKKSKLIGKISMLFGVLLLTGGLLLFGYNYRLEYLAGKVSDEALQKVKEQIVQNRYADTHKLEWSGTRYFGVLAIPKLNLELPIQSEWSYPKLKKTPCIYTGSIQDGGLVILAHNYRKHFGKINTLSIGDVVKLTDATGQAYTYLVEEVFTMEATDVEEMANNKYDLTLFTCTYGGKARVTVRCVLQNKADRYPIIEDKN